MIYLEGLAQIVQLKYARLGGVGVMPEAADSSAAATMNREAPTGLELFQQLGGTVVTEEVTAE